jgi:hypothetical protein
LVTRWRSGWLRVVSIMLTTFRRGVSVVIGPGHC